MAIWKFQVSPRPDQADPLGNQTYRTLRDFGIRSVDGVRTARLFLIDLDVPGPDEPTVVRRIADELLTDGVGESCLTTRVGEPLPESEDGLAVEVFFKPGVTDPVGDSTALALADMGIPTTGVRTGRRYEIRPIPDDRDLHRLPRLLGNDCIEDIVVGGRPIGPAPLLPTYVFERVLVSLREMDDPALERLSREQHLFLSLDEMRTIRQHFTEADRDPTDLELETLAQTWSEHCVHKTLKSAFTYQGTPFPGGKDWIRGRSVYDQPETTIHYDNLLADTIARATHELIKDGRGPECLSVFEDNAGVIGFDARDCIAIKVETHNHPSAIEPYGGAATGLGGVIRDILGCGLGARPVANTDVFCVAPPDWPFDGLPKGIIHPRAVLKGVVAGVRDYGNRMGIPTVNGAVHFDPRYLGNPLVYCGCVGLIPRDRIDKEARAGDAIVLMGGRTGRDGIHGATFSSAELSDSHEDEFAHAVQIGNPIEEKKVLDVILQARDYRDPPASDSQSIVDHRRCLFSAITDCGAGGLSSAIGEMGEKTGVEVNLERVPLKYAGLRYDEIWISEAQERMVLAVPEENVDALLALARSEDVEATVIGRFTDTHRLVVRYENTLVGDLDMAFLHEGLPRTTLTAEWHPPEPTGMIESARSKKTPIELLRQHLGDLNTASKHWIIRQFDHEVRGGSVVKPLVGPGDGPSDAAVIRPRLDSDRGVAIGCGMAPAMGEVDPYWMAVAAIDEAVRNVVCVGGDPRQTAILDNFCWPSSEDPHALGALVRACAGCYDAAKAYGLPFISGKDSLNNVFSMSHSDAIRVRDVINTHYPDASERFAAEQDRHPDRLSVPCSLLISAVAGVEDVNRCITSVPRLIDGAARLFFVGSNAHRWEDIHLSETAGLHSIVADLIREVDIVAAHDCGDGGVAIAVAEMAIASGLETEIFFEDDPIHLFDALPGGYVVQAGSLDILAPIAGLPGIRIHEVAHMHDGGDAAVIRFAGRSSPMAEPSETNHPIASIPVSALRTIWRAPLDW